MKQGRLSRFQDIRNTLIHKCGGVWLKNHLLPLITPKILGYHALQTPPFLKDVLGVLSNPTDFQKQIQYLTQNHTVLSMSDFLDHVNNRESFPPRSVMITFDDGYKDLISIAAPILRQYNLPATVFLSVDAISNQRSIWTNQLYYWISLSTCTQISLELPDGSEKQLRFDSPDTQKLSALFLSGYLKKIPEKERKDLLLIIARSLGIDPSSDPFSIMPMLTWDDVRNLQNYGFDIGSHTMTHPILSQCSPDTQKWELEKSRVIIESETQSACRTIAYPNGQPGDYTDLTLQISRNAGYRAGFTFHAGTFDPEVQPYAISRHPIFDVPISTFAVRLAFNCH